MSSGTCKVITTILLSILAFVLLQSPHDQRSFGTVPHQAEFASQAASDVQVVSTLLPTGIQQIVVVDTQAQTMAVYHIEPSQGKIQLKSVRRLEWDLKMEQFNAQSPLPSDLRAVQPY